MVMKKRLVSLLLCLTFLFSFFVFSTPVKVEATSIVESTSRAVDVDSVQLLDGEGYFIQDGDKNLYSFCYTKYLDNEVDFKENEAVYIKKINISDLPYSWFNGDTGLDPIRLGTVGISNGKWSLLKSYLVDVNNNILPNSFGYLENTNYSDIKKYIYYLSYRNEDGIDRPLYEKHYEALIEIESIPSYILTNDGKNEIMGICDGIACYTEIVKYNAIKQIDYFEEVHYGTTDLDSDFGDRYLFPVIYFNIHDIDYDYLLSVEFSYKVLEHKKKTFGGYSEEVAKKYDFNDILYFDEVLEYQENFKTWLHYFAMAGSSSDSTLPYMTYISNSEWFFKGSSKYSALQSGEWNKEVIMSNGLKTNKKFENRMVGHLTNLIADKAWYGEYRQKYTIEKESVKFLSVSYVYDGLIYTDDERIPINSTDFTPDDIFNDNIFDSLFKDLLDSLTKLPANIINTGVDLGKNALISFWNNLSTFAKFVITTVIVLLFLYFTFPIWYSIITKIIFRNDETSKQQSFRMFNNRALNKHNKRERKYENKMYLRQKNDSDSEYYRRRNDLMEDRDYISNRVDKKYSHETNLAEIKSRGYSVQHHHNDYTVTHKLANNKNRTKYDIPGDRKIKKTARWYKNYKDQEFAKLKKKNKNNSNESIEDLDNFFNKK